VATCISVRNGQGTRCAGTAERNALDAEMLAVNLGSTLSCDGSAKLEKWLAGVMKHGEGGYLRVLVEQRQGR